MDYLRHSPVLNPIENLQLKLKIQIQKWSPINIKVICQEK